MHELTLIRGEGGILDSWLASTYVRRAAQEEHNKEKSSEFRFTSK